MAAYDFIRKHTILVADDDKDDWLLVKDAFDETGADVNLRFVADGGELLDYLTACEEGLRPQPCPDLILLDLNMPVLAGKEALRAIKADPEIKHIPVVVLTTSNEADEVRRCYHLGASSFIVKPPSFDDLVRTVRNLQEYWLHTAQLPG